MSSSQDHMRKFLKIFLRSPGTYLGVGGGPTQPLVMVGFDRLVILITYGKKYFTMEAVSLVCTFARDRPSSPMCIVRTLWMVPYAFNSESMMIQLNISIIFLLYTFAQI